MAISADKAATGILATMGGCWLLSGLGVIAFWVLVFLALAKFVFGWSPF